jgi:hypothetical protein
MVPCLLRETMPFVPIIRITTFGRTEFFSIMYTYYFLTAHQASRETTKVSFPNPQHMAPDPVVHPDFNVTKALILFRR